MTHIDAIEKDSEIALKILAAVESLRYGSVEITIHEGRVTQIERREKVRFQESISKDQKPTVSAVAKPYIR